MVVSWSPNPDAQYFHVLAVSNTGARHHCNSSGTACTIRDLPCGRSYNVTVQSVRDDCESEPSAAVETSSGKRQAGSNFFEKTQMSLMRSRVFVLFISPPTVPCVPSNVGGHLDCVSNSAWVRWDPSEGALSYLVQAQEVGGHNSSHAAVTSPVSVPDLKCGTIYSFHVTAVNKNCHSNHSTAFQLETGNRETS